MRSNDNLVRSLIAAMLAGAMTFTLAAPSPAQTPSKPTVDAEPDGTLEAMIASAELANRLLQQQQDMGLPMTPQFIETKTVIARKLWNARRELAIEKGDRAAELAAHEAYVAQLRAMHAALRQRLAQGLDASQLPVAMIAVDLAEAKLLLARAKAGASPTSRPAPPPQK